MTTPPPTRISTLLGSPPDDIWAAFCSVDAAVYGEEAWAVNSPELEDLLRDRGFALALLWAGSSLVGFSSAVAVTDAFASQLVQAPYEGRPLAPNDVLPVGSQATWYGTSTCLLAPWRRRGLGTALLGARLAVIAQAAIETPQIRVVAQMWSQGGRANFAKYGALPVGPASMELASTPTALLSRIHTLNPSSRSGS